MESIELNNGQKINCKSLTKIEYNSLLKDTVGGIVERIWTQYNIAVHQLKNGQVVVEENSYYTLYDNLEDVDKVLLNAVGNSNGSEILAGKNIYGAKFPEEVPVLIKQLCQILDINYTSSNEQLLKDIDAKVNRLADPQQFRESHLIHFIALIGDVIIRKYSAEWKMELASDGTTWNPYLIINNQDVQFFVYLYEDIFINRVQEEGLLFGIYKTVVAIREHNL
ncbi:MULTISPECIES: hypothetical protein [Niastella]|uniref:DUF3806 domain-containing protein n=1 Tax=Niastella soli TaxID=2821487 RepID=A0ABS3Z265_9BACT|nr:hypothetical protein [Niastella soli]MBO9204219.1 hypothetical protein [Niastella soli]